MWIWQLRREQNHHTDSKNRKEYLEREPIKEMRKTAVLLHMQSASYQDKGEG